MLFSFFLKMEKMRLNMVDNAVTKLTRIKGKVSF